MRCTVLGLYGALAGLAAANVLEQRNNVCYNQARACPADCKSFLSYTVTPCPAVKTQKTTITVTRTGATTTRISTVTKTSSAAAFVTVTATLSSTQTLTSLETSTTAVTITATETTTTTTSPRTAPLLVRRSAVPEEVLPLEQRATGTCKPVTRRPSHIPSKARACTNSSKFSSACACLGYKPCTTTLPRKTTTTLATTTLVVSRTATATSTSTVLRTVTNTSSASATVTTTVNQPTTSTVVVTTTVQETATEIIEATATPSCTGYTLFAPVVNKYIGVQSLRNVILVDDPDSAPIWTVLPDGTVFTDLFRTSRNWASGRGGGLNVLVSNDEDFVNFSFLAKVTCTLNPDPSVFVGAVGTLSCTFMDPVPSVGTCTGSGDALTVFAPSRSDCSVLQIVAIARARTSCDTIYTP